MADKRQTNEQQIKAQMKTVDTELKDGVFVFTGPMTIQEFSDSIKKPATEIITFYFMQGKMYNMNHTLDEEAIAELCIKFDFDFKKEDSVDASNFMDQVEIVDSDAELVAKAPIITIMGHVDHGKTTLIDKIRNSNIAGGENGGITQHTAAYQVIHKDKPITFLDTPGHEAFTEMRARGAQLTDIVVLVVAADDGVMPQTKEAIEHAKAAGVPMIVFVNKIDKAGADIEKVKGDLSGHDIVADDWGGDCQFVYGSGLTGEGIDKLFEAINLESEMLELTANPNRLAIGTIVESHIETGRGVVASIVVQNGSLYKRDFIVAGSNYGRIRQLIDTHGNDVNEIKPGEPAAITGLNYSPQAGEKFFGFKDEKFAKQLASEKAFTDKQKSLKARQTFKVEDGIKVLNMIVKADAFGTSEAVKHSLAKLENEDAKVHIISSSVGTISKSDILLAQASDADIYAFNMRASSNVKKLAGESNVKVKSYTVIYKMIEEVETILKGMKAPKFEEKITGEAHIIAVIPSSKVGNIAGSSVTSGIIKSNSKIRLIRDGKVIHEGVLDGLQIGPNQASEVKNGKEFGCHIKKFNDVKIDDIIEAYEDVEVAID